MSDRALAGAVLAVLLLAGLGLDASGQRRVSGRKPEARSLKPMSAPAFNSNRAWEDLRAIVGFGPRPAGSAALAQTRRYIITELKKAGVEAAEQAFPADTPLGAIRMANVIGTIAGARPERIVLAGHIDTKLFREFRFVGASDAGSSTALLLELGRALKRRRNPFTIELLFLDGEEAVIEWRGTDHTYGSRYYVEHGRRIGTLGGVKALVLVDMIGDRHLNIFRETNSTPWLTDAIWSAAKRLGYDQYFLDERTTIEDDHLPFLQAGIPAVDIIDLDYAAWHTAGDTLDNVSARSLQVVGDVVLAALPAIETKLQR